MGGVEVPTPTAALAATRLLETAPLRCYLRLPSEQYRLRWFNQLCPRLQIQFRLRFRRLRHRLLPRKSPSMGVVEAE
jgi:hypothetical protein